MEASWIIKFGGNEINFKTVYTNKVAKIKDIKLAETNLKILHNILPCGENLVKWKKVESPECSICHHIESVTHLIYECEYSRQIYICKLHT